MKITPISSFIIKDNRYDFYCKNDCSLAEKEQVQITTYDGNRSMGRKQTYFVYKT